MSRAIACRDMCIWVKGAGSPEKSVFTETGIPKKLIAPHAIPLHVVKICSSHTYLCFQDMSQPIISRAMHFLVKNDKLLEESIS